MYDYPLSTIHKKIVESWLSKKDKPLFIKGVDGCGKTCLSKNLLKDYHIVEINSEHLKKSDIEEYIKNTLFKKNILMMCSGNHYKALLIDDVQLFISYDKANLKKIYHFLKRIDYSKYPIIIVCNLITHKYIDMLSNISYNITLSHNSNFYKSIISSNLEGDLSNTKLNNIIDISNNNLNTMKVNLNGLVSDKDTTYTIKEIINILFTKKNTINEVFRYFSSEYNVISLNLLENISFVIKKNYLPTLYSVYESMCMGDYTESKYLDKNLDMDIAIFFFCVKPYLHSIGNVIINTNYKYKYNAYIGRSIIQINNQSMLSYSDIGYMDLLKTLYRCDTSLGIDKSDIIDSIKIISQTDFDTKVLERQIKLFNYYYNKNMTRKQVNKILKTLLSMDKYK